MFFDFAIGYFANCDMNVSQNEKGFKGMHVPAARAN